MIKLLPTFAILVVLAALPQKSKCPCQPTLETDSPHGANEVIEYTGKTVKKLHGRILYPNGEPVNEAVVEIYEYGDADRNVGAYEITKSKERRTACLTDKYGYFCFTGLPSGRYALRAGTRKSEGMNEVYVKVNLEQRWWRSWLRLGKKLELYISAGT